MSSRIAGGIFAVILAVGVSGCSGNRGGDTSCKDFYAMDTNGQKEVITKVIEDGGETSNWAKVVAYQLSAKAYCAVNPADSKISGIKGNH